MSIRQSGTTRTPHGFTLLELAIVLVIIGLLAGGIVISKSIIRASQLQSVMSEYDRYVKATGEFIEKYQALHGDMNNATNYWGTNPAGCPSPMTATIPTATNTCNGDGNGRITIYGEDNYFWQHLANAGLIDGRYTGAPAPNVIWLAGVNLPASQLPSGGWRIQYYGDGVIMVNTGFLWKSMFGHMFFFNDNRTGNIAILKPSEAFEIDSKIDDGKPGTGKVLANGNTDCINGYDQGQGFQNSSLPYNTSYTKIACGLTFLPGF